jgi:hypothetical protein
MKLSRAQLERLSETIRPMVGYLHRLHSRMDDAGFEPTGRLYRLVGEAFDAVKALSVELHYLEGEAARAERDRPAEG